MTGIRVPVHIIAECWPEEVPFDVPNGKMQNAEFDFMAKSFSVCGVETFLSGTRIRVRFYAREILPKVEANTDDHTQASKA